MRCSFPKFDPLIWLKESGGWVQLLIAGTLRSGDFTRSSTVLKNPIAKPIFERREPVTRGKNEVFSWDFCNAAR
jgi:hypothetical protein